MSSPFYLVAWDRPKVRSGRAADELLHRATRAGDRVFAPSAVLAELRAFAIADPRISLDDELGWSPDRVVTLTLPWDAVDELGPSIAHRCEELGLVLLDVQHARLVVPRQAGAAPWPIRESPAIMLLRNATARVQMTGDAETDARALHRAVLNAFEGQPEDPRGG